jgi:hypothetical protein
VDRSTSDLDPPVRHDERGRHRSVGVEIELTGLDVGAIADTVADLFDGRVRRENDYLARVTTELGEFKVEVDLRLLQRIGRQRAEPDGDAGVVAAMRDAVANVAELIAPFELVSPPLPYPQLFHMDALAAALGERGGRGTDAGLLMALGLHLNPQVPASTAESIHAHLRAYVILEPLLRAAADVDVARRLTPFVDSFPGSYVQRLLEEDDPPPMNAIIAEYLRFNPTRNRSLDMLPFFTGVAPEMVAAAVEDRRIKSRPTFHYRLPDSRIGERGWRITDEWRRWLVVEQVAADPELLDSLATTYRGLLRGTSTASAQSAWIPVCRRLLGQISASGPSRADPAAPSRS